MTELYSQLGQDAWVLKHFPGPGMFVEAGASDGVLNSNTLALEKLGWAGICVEPGREFMALCKNRMCFVDDRCLWKVGGTQIAFYEPPEAHWAGIQETFHDSYDRSGGETVLVETITLPSLLDAYDAPRVLDYLSLDTEGSELEILQAHDFEAYPIRLITIEHNSVEPIRTQIREFLEARGFIFEPDERANQWDDWYFNPSVD